MSDDLEFEKDDEMQFDDNDDFGFDDDLAMDFDPFAEEPRPKGRSPVAHSIIKTGKHFRESLTEDKLETAKKVVKASVPSSISTEASQIGDIVNGVNESLSEVKKEVKKEAKPFLEALEKTMPKGGSVERIINLAKNKLGLDEDSPTAEQIAEDSANKAAMTVAGILGEQQDRELHANILRDTIRTKRELSSIELQATTASNLEFINKFNQDVVSKYQRKSLELQYRHLYTADEQLAITKTAFDGFKNQLESIVINSALPDLVKTHSSEFIKQKLFNKVTDGLFNSENVVNNIKNKFRREITAIGSTISGGLGAATTLLDTKNTMTEMSAMTGGTEGMIGGMLSDGVIGYSGKKIGNLLSKTKVGKGAVGYLQDLMIDPSEKLKKQAEGRNSGFIKDLLNTASDFTKRDSGETTYKVGKVDRNEAVSFDGKTQTSITKIIPGLLSKILSEVKGIRSGNDEEELRFDYDKGTFETVSDMKSTINKSIDNSLKVSGVNRDINNLITELKNTTGLKINNKDLMKLKEGLLGYILTGKPLSPVSLKDNGFYRYFSKDISGKLEESIDKYISDGNNKVRLNKELEAIRNNTPDPMDLISKYNDAGSMDVLKEKGLMKFNEVTGDYTLDNKKYKKILRNSLKNVKDEEDIIKDEDNSLFKKFATNLVNREKEKSLEPKKQSNFSKTLDKLGNSVVNTIDKGTDYISGDRLSKDTRKLYHSGRKYLTGKEDYSNFKFSTEGSFNALAPKSRSLGSDISFVRNIAKSIKSVDDVKNLINKKIINTDDGLFDAISKSMLSSTNPKDFYNNLKETEEFKTLSSDLQDRLEKNSRIVKRSAIGIKNAIKEDLEDTSIYKAGSVVANKTSKGAKIVINKFRSTRLFKEFAKNKDKIKRIYGKLGKLTNETSRIAIKEELDKLLTDMNYIANVTRQTETPEEIKGILSQARNIVNSLDTSDSAKEEFTVKVFEVIGLISSISGVRRKELIGNIKNSYDKISLKESATKLLDKLGLKGFKTGGDTSEFKKDEVAGYVHGDEEVVESSRLDNIAKILGIKGIKRSDIVDTGINILGNISKSLDGTGLSLKDFEGKKKTPEELVSIIGTKLTDSKDKISKKYNKVKTISKEAYDTLYAEDVKNKNFKNITTTTKEVGKILGKDFGKTISDKTNDAVIRLDRYARENLSPEQSKALKEFFSNMDDMKDNIKANLNVKLFIETGKGVLNGIKGFITRNPEKGKVLEPIIAKIENKLDKLSSLKDKVAIKELASELSTEINELITKATPDGGMLSKKVEEFEKKDVKDGTTEETFLDILNSDDPIGAMKYKIKQGIKNKLKGFAVKGAKKLFSFGKKLVLSDLERGKKLRGYLKDKFDNWRNDEPGAFRRAGNKALNKIGGLMSKGAKGSLELGKDAIDKDKGLGKKLRESIFDTVKKAVSSSKEKKNPFDKDGDGKRDGSWLTRIMDRKKNKEDGKDSKTLLGKVADKAKSPMGIATILTGAFMGLKAMGVTLDDISGFAKGAWNVLKGIGKVLSGIWGTLKTVGGWIKDAFGFIKTGLSKIPIVGKMFKDKKPEGMLSDEDLAAKKAKLKDMKRQGLFGSIEYKELNSEINDHYVSVSNSEKQSETSSGEAVGTAVAAAGGLYVAKKVSKPLVATYKVGKAIGTTGVSAVKGTSNIISKIAGNTPDIPVKGKPSGNKIMNMLKSFKGLIIKKMGPIGAKTILAKLAGKIAARAVPVAGIALLAYDAGKIAYDMATNGTSLKSAISKQILGFDLFSEDDLPKDENGEIIKPDEESLVNDVNKESKENDSLSYDYKDDPAYDGLDEVKSNTEYIKSESNNIVKKPKTMEQSFFEKLFSSNIFHRVNEKVTMGADAIKTAANKGWEAAKNFVSKGIGSVAAYFESGKRGPGTISNGRGDRGGASYGTHQLASKTGTLQKYLKGSKYGVEFNGLVPGTAAFNSKWKEIAQRDPEGFAHDQEAFISSTHYEPQVKKLKGNGLDVENRSDALKSAVYSVGVQFGPGSGLIPRAMKASNVNPEQASDAEIIKSIYGYKQNNNDSLFKSSSANIRKGTLNRAYKEEAMVMNLLTKEGDKSKQAVNNAEYNKTNTIDDTANKIVNKLDTKVPLVKADDLSTKINTVETSNIDLSNKVAGPAMVESVGKEEIINKPVMSSVTAEMKESNVTSKLNTVTAGLQTTNIDILTDTNKGIHKMSKTLDESLKVQKQMLKALETFNSNSSLTDRELKLSNKDKKETPKVKEEKKGSWDDIKSQEASSPNVNLGRKKYA